VSNKEQSELGTENAKYRARSNLSEAQSGK